MKKKKGKNSSHKNKTSFKSGRRHPRYRTDEQILAELRNFELGTLRSNEKIIMKGRSRRYAEYICIASGCKKTWHISVENIRKGATRNCRCHRARKYPKDGRAKLLGYRYDAMVQRTSRKTHKSWPNYLGRGIKVLFKSREDFIRWALQEFPYTDFIGLDFDRIDNDGNYSKDNLRLVPRRVNALNTRRSKAKRNRQ